MLTARRFLLVVAGGLALAGAAAYGSAWAGSGGATASGGGPEMRLTVKSGGACDGDTCVVPLGASFTLAVEIVGFPDGGYALLQTYVDMGSDLVYKPTDTVGDEFVWPDCLTSCGEQADVNGDSFLNSLDAALILQFTADLIQQLPAGKTR